MNYKTLKETLIHYNYLYYNVGRSVVTDEEYDILYDQLEKMEKKLGYCDPDSPTLRVGGNPGKIRHLTKLYSLKKVYDKKEIGSEFDITTPKIDGVNLTIIYEKGNILAAVTRGDGEKGDSVTSFIPFIKGIPETISTEHFYIINGECVTDSKVDNFRNYVAGALNLKDVDEFKTRNIRFIAHDILDKDINYNTKLDILKNMGFDTVNDDLCSNYPSDGVVYRINDWYQCKKLGYTSKYPRFAIALKEREQLTAITKLVDVQWNIGRTGIVTPTGIVNPVELDGATISRVTLHNYQHVIDNDLGFGDTIHIERAGGVIPKFLKVIKHADYTKYDKHHAEIYVGHDLIISGPFLKSPNKDMEKAVYHFAKVMEIRGLGPSTIRNLGITHIVDIYSPDTPWSSLGEKISKKLLDYVERSKHKNYVVVLASLGIPRVGKALATKIATAIPDFRMLKDNIENTEIKDVGPKIIKDMKDWLEENEDWVLTLPLQLEYNLTGMDVEDFRYKVVVSGKLDMTKIQLEDHLMKKGIEVRKNLTKDCHFLISDGNETTLKYKKAQYYGVPIINYWDNREDILQGKFYTKGQN